MRYDLLLRIIGLRTMKTIHIILSPELTDLCTLQSRKPPHLHNLSFDMRPRGLDVSELPVLLGSLKDLNILDLRYCAIGDYGVLILSETFKSNTTLVDLILRSNGIDNAGACALSEALKVNKTLLTLDLQFNMVGHKGAVALAEALKVNRTLKYLDLKHNAIGGSGVFALSKALKVNKIVALNR
ncbi:hypothetical protein BCR41DRAFT_244299 [Lobosporangium transversale]|uniref:RNI-like protein n=1 Tax=Lobosporangium transversale TaxID=64571 RepID=A0A1Y2GW87_9FUNG|nr:hypothetical protein BCR41DRAFT_244299 [Lobosporangium transversale]ORZ23694.1 hypothetical protein BCR41DRAFT_244299 [Lobosporangium transversale]|eukprot:XP_021883508.1 hypothetical protein BCR41DRAFT_244299 [Lobosporangium transversale]